MTDLETLLALEEIKQLKARYFRHVDQHDWDAFAALFTEDAVMDMSEGIHVPDATTGQLVPPPGSKIPPFAEMDPAASTRRGVPDIISYVRNMVDGSTGVHHGHNPEIALTGPNTAKGLWAMDDYLLFREGLPIREMHGYGHYHETYRLTGDGWRISSTKLTRLRVDILG